MWRCWNSVGISHGFSVQIDMDMNMSMGVWSKWGHDFVNVYLHTLLCSPIKSNHYISFLRTFNFHDFSQWFRF